MTTPLTVQLPFNRDILGREFTPAKRGGKPAGGRGHWVLAQEQNLLVVPARGAFALPHGDCPVALNGSEPLWLGTYRDEPVWVVPIAPDAPVPAGLACETVVPMRGTRLPDELLSLGGMALQALWWESTSGHCPRCGAPTTRIEGEWGKKCPRCGYEHYPHLHPATIVLVRDGQRVLLTRKAGWAPNRYALVDLGLPGMSGYELGGQLRRAPFGEELLIVAITGYGQPDDRRRTTESGFDAHLVKPVSPETLLEKIAGARTRC